MSQENAVKRPPRRGVAAVADPPPAPAPAKPAPALSDYHLFGLIALGEPAAGDPAWVPLGRKVPAATYSAAMELAKDRLRDRIVALATEEAPVPPTLKLTVAAIASRNWNQGTAIVEMQPVTTWERGEGA